MNKYISIICIIAVIVIGIGIFAYNFLEIYDREVYEFPSPEVRANNYLALERWLLESGHPVRTSQFAELINIMQADENVVVMNSSSFYWEKNTFDVLKPWIEEGHHLFVFHDYWKDAFHDEDFYSFVNHFNVRMITPGDEDIFEDEMNEADNDTQEPEPHTPNADDEETVSEKTEEYPYVDRTIRFVIEEGSDEILCAGIDDETINLVHIPFGNGSVTFTGNPYFMQNYNIKTNENRLLAWNVTGAKDNNKNGILFVEEIEFQNTFLQDLINEGNIFPLLISIFILTIVCFWGFIPRFGKIIADEESPGKPIRERFLAEAIFLKKFHSLRMYIDAYEKTIQQRFRKNYGEYIDDRKKFCIRLAEITKLDAAIIEQSLYPKGLITASAFAKCMKTIEIIMERL